MSSYALPVVNGMTARQLDAHRTRGALAAVYAIPYDGSGLITFNGEHIEFESPSAALASWQQWMVEAAAQSLDN